MLAGSGLVVVSGSWERGFVVVSSSREIGLVVVSGSWERGLVVSGEC